MTKIFVRNILCYFLIEKVTKKNTPGRRVRKQYKKEITLGCLLYPLIKHVTVKGYLCPILVSNIIGYLRFCGVDSDIFHSYTLFINTSILLADPIINQSLSKLSCTWYWNETRKKAGDRDTKSSLRSGKRLHLVKRLGLWCSLFLCDYNLAQFFAFCNRHSVRIA